jgi:hypothetical protein
MVSSGLAVLGDARLPWRLPGAYDGNIVADLRAAEIAPWADALYKQRMEDLTYRQIFEPPSVKIARQVLSRSSCFSTSPSPARNCRWTMPERTRSR